jgi:hypothetical protein
MLIISQGKGCVGNISVMGAIECRAQNSSMELKKHPSTLGVDGIGNLFSPSDLLIGVDTGCAEVAATRDGNGGCLGNDQTSFRSALAIILDHERIRDVARLLGALTGERGHGHPMRQVDRAELER